MFRLILKYSKSCRFSRLCWFRIVSPKAMISKGNFGVLNELNREKLLISFNFCPCRSGLFLVYLAVKVHRPIGRPWLGRFQRDNDETKQKWGNIKHHLWHFIVLFFNFFVSTTSVASQGSAVQHKTATTLTKSKKVSWETFLSWFHTSLAL